MTDIPATQEISYPPSLPVLLDALKRCVALDINCVKIGVIQSFDPGNSKKSPTAKIKIAQQQVTSIAKDGTRTISEYPILLNVPVYFPSGGNFLITFPVNAGDECIVLFNDRQIDNWLNNGPGNPPDIGRLHDLSDGIAIVGIRSNPNGVASISSNNLQIRSKDGSTLIDMSSGKIQLIADEVVIHGRNKTTFDAGGTGFVYTVSQIDTYTDGVTTNHHAPNPPEVPT